MAPSDDPVRHGSTPPPNPNPVVSVRLDRGLVERLDALVERTGRSRGFYIRTAIEDALSDLEVQYWGHEAVTRAQEENRQFGAMMKDLNDDGGQPGGPWPRRPEPGSGWRWPDAGGGESPWGAR